MQEMQETQVQSLGPEDLLEEGMATDSCNLSPGESHGQRSLASYSAWGRGVEHDSAANILTFTFSPSKQHKLHCNILLVCC